MAKEESQKHNKGRSQQFMLVLKPLPERSDFQPGTCTNPVNNTTVIT